MQTTWNLKFGDNFVKPFILYQYSSMLLVEHATNFFMDLGSLGFIEDDLEVTNLHDFQVEANGGCVIIKKDKYTKEVSWFNNIGVLQPLDLYKKKIFFAILCNFS